LPTTCSGNYFQQQSFEEFLQWCVLQFGEKCSELHEDEPVLSEVNFDFVIMSLVMVIVLAILGNYLWSKRKGRKYSPNFFLEGMGLLLGQTP
jgi:hypothetical protein